MTTILRYTPPLALALALGALGAGCGGSEPANCALDTNMGCSAGQVCERVRGGRTGQTACFAPVSVAGRVFDIPSNAGLASARVVAIDANGAAASGVATTAADGTYTLRIPTERDTTGRYVDARYTLRADADGHQSFPGGIRPAIPVSVAAGTTTGDAGTVVMNPTTDIGLFPLPAGQRGAVEGVVEGTDHAGVLVVGGGSTAISDRDGSFVLFNVTPGAVTVRGYAQSVLLNPAMVTVTAGMRATGVRLTVASGTAGTVSGSLQLVNAGGVSATSVVLAVRETYNTVLDRGEVPRGLRLDNISGAFTFTGVPAGEYAVLAAFENDGAVRDPDPGISGTDVVYVTVPANGGAVTLPQSFKVTGALPTISPGRDQPEAVTGTPTLRWGDDSSEDGYEVRVYDALGNIVWENLDLPNHTGGSEVSVMYGGPALSPGMYYQFRVTSWRSGRGGVAHAPIARTEELRGVFFVPR